MNFTTQCGENRHTDMANFETLIHKKILVHCVAILTILYGNYYPPHGEFKLLCIEGSKLACDTGGHFTNYPTWPLPRTNLNVDVLNDSFNFYALADLMLYRLSVNINHITLCLQTF